MVHSAALKREEKESLRHRDSPLHLRCYSTHLTNWISSHTWTHNGYFQLFPVLLQKSFDEAWHRDGCSPHHPQHHWSVCQSNPDFDFRYYILL